MKKPVLKYVGDKNIRNLLDRHECPVPFHAVRTRFLGNVATLRTDATPIGAIKDLWYGDLPEFDGKDDAAALVQDLLSLWNTLARHQSRTRPFKLLRGGVGSSVDDLEQFCRTRTEEFEGFIEGLLGSEETVDLPEQAVQAMEELGNINAMFHSALDLSTRRPAVTATRDELSATFKNLKMLERSAEKEINMVVLACKKARAQAMTWEDMAPPTLH